MAAANTSEIFFCTPEQFFSIITDYEKYPTFLPEVKACKVVRSEGNKKLVEFQVSVIKTFTYRLWLTEDKPKRLSWEFESGEIFKTNSGSWELADLDGKTQVKYSVEATFKVFLPGPVAKGLVNVNLPNMMKAYHGQVKARYG